MLNILWNGLQQVRIEEMESGVRDAADQARIAAGQAVEQAFLPYANQLDRLSLVCQAMWSLLRERTGLTEKDLLERVTELDRQDGALDGKCVRPPPDCPACGSKMSRKFNRCLFCGEPIAGGSAFDPV